MISGALVLTLLVQAGEVTPVLAFPEPGLDDTSAYQGYQTRFYRDSKANAVQLYLEPRGGRAVQVWADAANESVGFTARDGSGRPVRLDWDADQAEVSDSGAGRIIAHRLVARATRVELGWFLLGSMRVERDFQYAGRHLQPFGARPFRVAEESLLVAAVGRLPPEERRRHLALLRARSMDQLRGRLQPTIATSRTGDAWRVRITRPSLDGRNRLAMELVGDLGETEARSTGRTVVIESRSNDPVRFRVRIITDAAPLTPLAREEIFRPDFLRFLADAGEARDSASLTHHRRMERQVRAIELLSSREKLMAGLPNFATYFGRDMMMTALMMRPVWVPSMSEHVIASVLRKLGPGGSVSHEEALGGQAIRENALVYDSLVTNHWRARRAGRETEAAASLALARDVLRDLQATRENYHMIDDEYQLPVLVARYLADTILPSAQKRAFLLDSTEAEGPRLGRLLRELALVAGRTRPYVDDPRPLNLVAFPKRDSVHWRSASWRDSDAGYAGGRFAMDVNALWVPQALEAIATIFATLPALGVTREALDSAVPDACQGPLATYLRDTTSLRQAIDTWRGARRHFEVALAPDELRTEIRASLAALPEAERRYWSGVMDARDRPLDTLAFLALSLDSAGRPIPVVNTDPATGLFLEDYTGRVRTGALRPESVLRDVAPFVRPYPVALFVERLGPLVANDAYASPEVRERFRKDPYHGPRVVWGREVNLLFLGLAHQLAGLHDDQAGAPRGAALEAYARTLDAALRRTLAAVSASGLEHNELWSYRIEGGRLLPTRYGTSSDIQLWNGTDLAVQYVLSRLPGYSADPRSRTP